MLKKRDSLPQKPLYLNTSTDIQSVRNIIPVHQIHQTQFHN